MEKKDYKKDELTVHWNPKKCIHSGNCVRTLNSVFKPKERPWVQVENGSKEEIKAAVDKCPSGALSYTDPIAEAEEAVPVLVTIVRNGPARIKGKVRFKDIEGNESVKSGMFSICRCGLSDKMPFCNGQHKMMTPPLDE